MAHKTLIGGTAYEITGGKNLVDGTAYSIKSGKTLVGGTAYEVGFGHPVILSFTKCLGDGVFNSSVTINTEDLNVDEDGSGDGYTTYVTVASSDSVVISSGHETTVSGSGTTQYQYFPKIYLNGNLVISGAAGEMINYVLDVSSVTHVMIASAKNLVTRETVSGITYIKYDIPTYIWTYDFTTPKDVAITVTVEHSNSWGTTYIEHNGIKYTSASTFTAKTGDIIFCHTEGNDGTNSSTYGEVILNGVKVNEESGDGYYDVDFYYIVNSDATIDLYYYSYYGAFSKLTITET